MRSAIRVASQVAAGGGIPVVLDPVFAERSTARTEFARQLLRTTLWTMRCNAAEAAANTIVVAEAAEPADARPRAIPASWLEGDRSKRARLAKVDTANPPALPTDGWMNSEPLTLEEEHANQLSWCEDELKLTFIVCAAPPGEPVGDLTRGMAGDVNAFFTAWDTSSDEDE